MTLVAAALADILAVSAPVPTLPRVIAELRRVVIIGAAFAAWAVVGPDSSLPIAAAAQRDDTGSLNGILAKVRESYDGIHAYSDEGRATMRDLVSPQRDATQHFSTQFERSRRFSWKSDLGSGSDYRIVFEGSQIRLLRQGEQQTVPTLAEAIAGATGISHSAAYWVPSLLMPELFPRDGLLATFRRAMRARRLANQEVAGQPCYVLEAVSDEFQLRAWFGMRDFLVRRIEERTSMNIITTTEYTPQTDISLSP